MTRWMGLVSIIAFCSSPAVIAGRITSVTASSSIDGASLHGQMYIPQQFNKNGPEVPFVAVIRGGRGDPEWPTGGFIGAIGSQLEKRGWLGMTIGGRSWKSGSVVWKDNGRVVEKCTYQSSMAYVNSKDPTIGPGLQDVLDMIEWAAGNYPVDRNKIYGIGVSLGGRGMYAVALKAPDLFAGIGLMHPASDEFDLDIRLFDFKRSSRPCRMAVAGGRPGTSAYTATMRTLQSGRFLIENAYHVPIFVGHTDNDQIAWNVKGSTGKQFNHSYHMVMDTTWNGCYRFEGKDFCFGHTPTLSQLRARHADGYRHAYMFTHASGSSTGHASDVRWLNGAKKGEASAVGVENPAKAGYLIGAFDFLSRFSRVVNPATVVFKTYTHDVRTAYWLVIDIESPWTNVPGGVRARQDSAANSCTLELTRVDTITIDLAKTSLALPDNGRPLTVILGSLAEPVYDPALMPKSGDANAPILVLTGDFSGKESVAVTANGTPLTSGIQCTTTRLSIGPLDVKNRIELVIGTSSSVGIQKRSMQSNGKKAGMSSTGLFFNLFGRVVRHAPGTSRSGLHILLFKQPGLRGPMKEVSGNTKIL